MYRMKKKAWPLLAMVAMSSPATAQIPPVAIPASDFGPVWTGFYVGAAFGAGGAVNKIDTSSPGLATTFDGRGGSGVLGSVYSGFDYQVSSRGLLGLLAELSYSGFQGSANSSVPFGGANANINTNTGLGWEVLARAGILASPATPLYLVGGSAGQNIHADGFATAGGQSASFSNDRTVNGWTIGPGFETMLSRNLSAKLEYRYSQFGRLMVGGGNTSVGLTPYNHAVRAGSPGASAAWASPRRTSARRPRPPTSTGPGSTAAPRAVRAWASAASMQRLAARPPDSPAAARACLAASSPARMSSSHPMRWPA